MDEKTKLWDAIEAHTYARMSYVQAAAEIERTRGVLEKLIGSRTEIAISASGAITAAPYPETESEKPPSEAATVAKAKRLPKKGTRAARHLAVAKAVVTGLKPGSVSSRVLAFLLKHENNSFHTKAIAKALKLPETKLYEPLRTLIGRGEVKRVSPGVYCAV